MEEKPVKTLKRSPGFKTLPKTYEALCRRFLPRPVHDRAGFENTVEAADVFAGFEDQMTEGQRDYFDLLCALIAEYERETVKPPELTSLDLLRHLLEEHGLSGADLSRLLGRSPAVGPMILRGERAVTASHALALSGYFGLPAGLFLEKQK